MANGDHPFGHGHLIISAAFIWRIRAIKGDQTPEEEKKKNRRASQIEQNESKIA